MSRTDRMTLLLTTLGILLLLVLWFLFLFKPASDDLAEVNTEIEETQARQDQLRVELERLRSVRADSPSIESTLSAYETLVPSDPGLPALLRQLQTAATDSGMALQSVAPSEPSPLETEAGAEPVDDLQSIAVAVELEGGYFQLVDFLRRLENPAIVGRVVLVDGLTVGLEEYPTLTVGMTARVFTTSDVGMEPDAPTSEPTPSPTDTESPGADTPTPDTGPTTTEVPS